MPSGIPTHEEPVVCDVFGYRHGAPEELNHGVAFITTNLEYEHWPRLLGNREPTEALLSRLRHQCQTIHVNGPSLREPQG